MNDIDPNNTPTNTQGEFVMPESFSGNAAFEGIDSYDKLFQGYADTHKAHADLQASQPVLPDDAAGYEITVPEGQQADEGLMTAFKGWMHEANMPNDKAQNLSNQFNEFVGQMATAQETEKANALQASVDGLKTEWGTNFDANAEVANKGLQRFFDEAKIGKEDRESFAAEFGNNTTAIKLFHAIGSKISESPSFQSDGTTLKSKTPIGSDGKAMLHNYDI